MGFSRVLRVSLSDVPAPTLLEDTCKVHVSTSTCLKATTRGDLVSPKKWFTIPYHALIVLLGHCVCVSTIDALETIFSLFTFVRTHPDLGVPMVQSHRLLRYQEQLPISHPTDFIRSISGKKLVSFWLGWICNQWLPLFYTVIMYPVLLPTPHPHQVEIKYWMIRDDNVRCASCVQCCK